MLDMLKGELEPLKKDVIIFDQSFQPLMADHSYMTGLKEDPWDRYRDLNKVWQSEILNG